MRPLHMLAPLLLPLLALAADPAALERHVALAAEATAAERALDPARAEALCREAVALLPDGPRAQRCARRVAFLEARRDPEGGYDGWIALERARARFVTDGADAVRAALIDLSSREGLAHAVRAEVAVWLALDDLDRRDDPAWALARTGPLLASQQPLDSEVRRLLVTAHARALARAGRGEEARAAQAEVEVPAAAPRPTPVDRELDRHVKARTATAAWATLGVFGLVAAPLVPRGLATRPRPWGLAVLALAVGGAWAVAEAWEPGAGRALPWMGLGFAGIHVVALAARATPAHAAWRGAVAVLAATATLAVAWLALVGTGTLAWVGL